MRWSHTWCENIADFYSIYRSSYPHGISKLQIPSETPTSSDYIALITSKKKVDYLLEYDSLSKQSATRTSLVRLMMMMDRVNIFGGTFCVQNCIRFFLRAYSYFRTMCVRRWSEAMICGISERVFFCMFDILDHCSALLFYVRLINVD